MLGLLFYSYTYPWFQAGRGPGPRWRPLLYGGVFGGLAVVLMIARIQVQSGEFVDARSVPLALIALFEGWPAAVAAAALPAAYRAWLGGDGMVAGIVGLATTAGAGALVHEWARRHGGVRHRDLVVLGTLVYLGTLGSFVVLGARGLALFGPVWPAYLVLYVVGIVLVGRLFRDTVERERLALAQERFRAIIDEASEAIRIVDPDTLRILDCNRKDCEISGYDRGEMIGRDAREFWPREPALRMKSQLSYIEARTEGVARNFGLPYRRRSGELVSIDSTRRIVEHGGRRYEIVIFREAAEREATEAARREAGELRAVTLLARGAAHEINNPLAALMGSLDLLGRRVAAEGQERKWVEQALAAAARIRDIVFRMNRITRIEAQPAQGALPPILDIKRSSDAPTAAAPSSETAAIDVARREAP